MEVCRPSVTFVLSYVLVVPWDRFDPVPRSGHGLAPAARASARPGEAGAPAKHEAAVLAGRRLEDEPARPVSGERPDDMGQVVFHLPFRETQ